MIETFYAFFANHTATGDSLASLIYGGLGGYIAWAWIFRIQNGENDTTEKADKGELFNRILTGAGLGLMFGELWDVIFVSILPMLKINTMDFAWIAVVGELSWVIAGFVGIMGKPFVKKFLTMLGEDVFDFHRKYKDKAMAGELDLDIEGKAPPKIEPTKAVEHTVQKSVHTAVAGVTEEMAKIIPPSIVAAPVTLAKRYFSQLNPAWKDLPLPNSATPSGTIGRFGCFLSCIGMMLQIPPNDLAYQNPDCFQPDNNMLADKLLARYGSTIRREDVAGGTLPKSVCIARTSFYANKGIPTHFMLQFEDGSIVDPAEVFPTRKMMPKYNGTINQHRYISNHKL